MPAEPLKHHLILTAGEARRLILRVTEPRQSILLERLESNPIGLEQDSSLPGLRWRVTGYKWYPRGMGEDGKNATLWPVRIWEKMK